MDTLAAGVVLTTIEILALCSYADRSLGTGGFAA